MGTPIEPTGDVQDGTGVIESGEVPGQNPAWSEVLGVLPEQFHEVVTPHFQKWDQEAQKRIEAANQSVTQFEPYKPFAENGISPQDLEQGLQLMYQLNQNPQAVYQALAEAYGFGAQSNPEVEETEEESQQFQDPRFEQIQSGLDTVAQIVLQREQEKIEAQANAEIDSELNQLKEKHPGISEEFALALMVNGFDVNQVGERWNSMTQNVLQQNPRPFAPSVMGNSGGGTGLPSQAIDPRKLNGQQTRDLVAQMARLGTQD
jgi:hypothetical protein